MQNIIETIKNQVATLVHFTSSFAISAECYYAECNKSSKEYDHERATHFLKNAQYYSKEAIAICAENGLNAKEICMNCIEFQQQYKRAA